MSVDRALVVVVVVPTITAALFAAPAAYRRISEDVERERRRWVLGGMLVERTEVNPPLIVLRGEDRRRIGCSAVEVNSARGVAAKVSRCSRHWWPESVDVALAPIEGALHPLDVALAALLALESAKTGSFPVLPSPEGDTLSDLRLIIIVDGALALTGDLTRDEEGKGLSASSMSQEKNHQQTHRVSPQEKSSKCQNE